MPLLTAADMTALRATLAGFTDASPTAQGTLYDSAGANPRPCVVAAYNTEALRSGRTATDFMTAQFPYDTTVTPGDILEWATDRSGRQRWYLIKKVSTFAPDAQVAIVAQVMPIPLLLTARRQQDPALPATLNAYDEAMTWDNAGRPIPLPVSAAPVTTFTVRAGLSNDNNPLTNDVAGQLPAGIRTLYVPLGAGLCLGDTLVMPDGREGAVQQVNDLDAEGVPWAYQVLVDATAGGL